MRLVPESELSLRLEKPWSQHAPARSAVMAGGRATGQAVAGEVLEAAIGWNDCCLLFVTDAIPFENSLRIYLLDARWQLVDSAKLGGMYTTGAFSGLELAPPDNLCFRFIGGIAWELAMLDRSVPSLPFFAPKGVSRPLGFTQRFRIHGRPRPETGT